MDVLENFKKEYKQTVELEMVFHYTTGLYQSL